MPDLVEYKSMGVSTQSCEPLGLDSNLGPQEPCGGSNTNNISPWSFSTFPTLARFPIETPLLIFLILVLDKQRAIYNLLAIPHSLIQDILSPHT